MPYIQARLSIELTDIQKDNIQSKMTEVVSEAFAKPKMYIMSEIQDNCNLYMSANRLEKGAYISVSLLGTTTKDRCNMVSKRICEILKSECNIDGSKVYITFHPVELWGWNGMMF